MIEWLNFIVLALSTVLITYFYVKSVQPATLEKKIGESAYRKCTIYRFISMFFMFVLLGNYIIYVFYPLPLEPLIPTLFPWDWMISVTIAIIIGIPSLLLTAKGELDAGKETMVTRKDHQLYEGIYQKIRHPQTVGELFLTWTLAFFLHSPFLVLYTFIFIPIYYYACIVEEKDLVIRYGKPYEEYRKTVGMFLPRLRG